MVILRLVSPIIKSVGERVEFEKGKFGGPFIDGKKGICAFHVSSQGELEQCFTLIERAINLANDGSVVEIIYTSESVQQNIEDLVKIP